MSIHELDSRTLRDLVHSKPAAGPLFDALREGELDGDGQTTVDDLAALDGVSRRQAIDVLRGLADAGGGDFKVGRKGHPSRIEWAVDPRQLVDFVESGSLAEDPVGEARGEAEVSPAVEDSGDAPADASAPALELRSPEPEAQASLAIDELAPSRPPAPSSTKGRARRRVEASAAMIEHVHRLRPDLAVRVELPADLSVREAEVLADWVRNLSFER